MTDCTPRTPVSMIRNSSDRLIVFRAILAPIALFYPIFFGFPNNNSLMYFLGLFIVVGDTNYLLHLHIHRPFFFNRTLNIIFDLLMGFSTGMMASNWRIQHLYGHHLGHDYMFRFEHGWELDRYSPTGAILFSLRSMLPTFVGPIIEAFKRGILKEDMLPINYRWAFIEQIMFIAVFAGLAIVSWKIAFFYLFPWYFATYFISRYVDYLNHYGCIHESSDVFASSNNCVSKSFNLTTHNFGYHTAHHLRPGAHWTQLPTIHEGIKIYIPKNCIKKVSWSFLLFPYHLVRGAMGRM
jgi:fatty acid desaturase